MYEDEIEIASPGGAVLKLESGDLKKEAVRWYTNTH